MHKFEIEIKTLLGSKDKADELMTKMKQKDPALKVLGAYKQLNHYFVKGNLKNLFSKTEILLDDENRLKLLDLSSKAQDASVRTRWANGKVLLIVKATINDTTSENGTARLEWETEINRSIYELDQLVLNAGFEYLSKWSRDRQEYQYKNLSVSIDKTAGYGYLAEFEKVIDDQSKADETKTMIKSIMDELSLSELPQDRLQRMFALYIKNWQVYYGSNKTF